MASPDIRKLLLRVQTDADFYNLLLVDPEQALTDYEITPAEREVLLKRDRSIYQFLTPNIQSVSSDEDDDEKPDIVLKPFPDVTLPPLHPVEIPSGGGLTLHLPPLTLTLGSPPPPPPLPPLPSLPVGRTGSPPIEPPPPDPFFPIPPTPDPPPPPPPDPPVFAPIPRHPETPEIFQLPPISFSLADADVRDVPTSLISTIQESSGEERAQAIMQLLKMLDRR